MPRTPAISGPYRDLLGSTQLNLHYRVEVQNGSGTFINLMSLGGTCYVDRVDWSEDVDNPVSGGTLTLAGGQLGDLLEPLNAASPLNVDDTSAYSPLIHAGRKIRIWEAVMATGVIPATPDWHLVFLGKIDGWSSQGEQLNVNFRDIGAYLLDALIEEEREYSDDTGVPLQEVLRQILDNNGFESVAILTLIGQDPGWNVRRFILPRGGLLEGMRALAQQIGWDLRYTWMGGNDNFELFLYDPERTASAVDFTIPPNEYLSVDELAINDANIRNVGLLRFKDRITGTVQEVRVQDDASIAVFGRRFIEINEASTSNIDSFVEAQAMLLAVISDLSTPIADHTITSLDLWPVMLGDLIGFPANAYHYTDDQKFAVVGIRRTIENGEGRVQLRTRGKPAGAYMDWIRKHGPGPRNPAGLPNPTFGELLGEVSALGGTANDGRVWWEVTWDDATEYIVIWAEESADQNVPTPDVGSSVETAWTLYRPEGTEGRARDFSTTVPMAIRPEFWARLMGAGFTAEGTMGPLATPQPIQAADNDPPYVDGVLTSFSATPTALQDGFLVSVGVGAIDPTTESWLFIERENMVVFRFPLGTTGSRTINFLDTGLLPSTARTYKAYVWTRGQSGPPWGSVASPVPPPNVGPRFAANTPRVVTEPSGARVLLIAWECEDPLANAVDLQYSGNLINWVTLNTAAVSAPGTVAGSWFIGSLAPAYYRLVSRSGGTYLTYTLPVRFEGDRTLPGGPSDTPPILEKIIRLSNGLPQLWIGWTCQNGDADILVLEQSAPGAGVWTEVLTTSDIASGAWNGGAFTFTAKDYRMRAVRFSDNATIATSAVLAYDGQL